MFNLTGKIAIVTGSARGIGQSIAVELARQGANVVVADIISGNTTVNKIKTLKRKSFFIKVDVSKKEEIENVITETIKKFKKIDILVNNAGIFQPSPSETLKESDWEKTIDINLKGYFLFAQSVGKHMLKRKKGNIINIASVAGIRGYAQSVAYCSSKGGINLLTKSLAAEWSPQGIRVNCICPGIIETAMTKDILSNKKTKQGMLMKIPLKRTGKPIDIAGGAVFLASDASSYITGQELVIDGGWTSVL
jgi:NAD(P)-dependent dehydrogenase (short-subunit alcohol dehydrogenase family)